MTSPVLLPYTNIGVTLNPCKVPPPLCTSAPTRVRLVRLRVAKPVNSVTPLKQYVLQLPLFPRLAECLHVMLLALGPPSAMMSSSLHHLKKVLLLLLSSNRYSSRILKNPDLEDFDLNVPKFNCFFPGDQDQRRQSCTRSFSKCSAGQSSIRESIRHGCRHLHDGAACRRGTHWN